jgi:exosortase
MTAKQSSMARYAPVAALGLVWLVVFRQFVPDWNLTPQYSYGWFVPVLAGWAGWQRWLNRPRPVVSSGAAWIPALMAVVLAGLGPILWLQAGNRDWRLVGVLLIGDAVVLTLLTLAWCGGWGWARHFLFPVVFPVVAAPWPTTIEAPLIQGMMRLVANLASAAMQLAGVAASAKGNLILLPEGPVGVDEACSGIQSFQGSVMVALFLGEYFSFLAPERILLVVFSAALAFAGNVARALFLSSQVHASGLGAVDRWHDPAGYALMVFCYAGIFGFAAWWARGGDADLQPAPPADPHRPLPAAVFAAGALWVLAALGGTEWWYRRTEPSAKAPGWSVRLDGDAFGKSRDYTERERTMMRYDDALGRDWDDNLGRHWTFNYFRWELGNAAADNARFHRPTICLAASGYEEDGSEPSWSFEKGGVKLTVRQFRFKGGDRSLDSFYCLWDPQGRPGYSDPTGEWDPAQWSAGARVRNAISGRRGGELQMLNVGVFGAASPQEAAAAFRDLLEKVIEPAAH